MEQLYINYQWFISTLNRTVKKHKIFHNVDSRV